MIHLPAPAGLYPLYTIRDICRNLYATDQCDLVNKVDRSNSTSSVYGIYGNTVIQARYRKGPLSQIAKKSAHAEQYVAMRKLKLTLIP